MKLYLNITKLLIIFLIAFMSVNVHAQQTAKEPVTIGIFPNPSSGFVTIELKGVQNYNISLVNIIGVEVYSSDVFTNYEEQHRLSLTNLNLENGIYLVKIMHNNKSVATQKLVYRRL